MAFTQVNLQTQQLLESTFISDMRIIINANTILLKNAVQDAFNNLEIDAVNKKLGVDNPLTSIYTSDLRVGNLFKLTDGTVTIGEFKKSNGKSVLDLDQITVKAGGSIDASGTASKIAVTRLGVGVANLAALTTDGLTVGSASALTVEGRATFSNSIVESSQSVSTTLASTSATNTYQCDVTLSATSKSLIELDLTYPIVAASANNLSSPIIVVNVYTSVAQPPVKGQSFTFVVKSVKGSDNVSVNTAWKQAAVIRVSGGWDATKQQILINQQATAASNVTTIAGPYLRFNQAFEYGGAGTLTTIDTTATPYRFVTTSATGYCTVAQS